MKNLYSVPQYAVINFKGTKMKLLFFKIFSVLIAIIVIFLALEGAYRLYKFMKYGMLDYPDLITLGIVERDPLYGIIPKKNFRSDSISPKIRFSNKVKGFEKLFTFNSLGYRGAEFSIKKDPNTFRIVTFGGSTTMSIGSSDPSTWSARLEKMLQQNTSFRNRFDIKNVEVINAGVGSWRTREGLIRLTREVRHFDPDLLMVAFSWNDFGQGLEGINPDELRMRKKRWWLYSKLLENIFIRWIVYQGNDTSKYNSDRKNLQHDKYWVETFERNILAMKKIASDINAKIALVNLPGLCRKEADASEKKLIVSKTRVTPANFPFWVELKIFVSKIIADLNREHGIEVSDVSSCLERFHGLRRLDLFVDEMHFTEQGSEEVARCVYSSLVNELKK